MVKKESILEPTPFKLFDMFSGHISTIHWFYTVTKESVKKKMRNQL